jgi:hypothetical protein
MTRTSRNEKCPCGSGKKYKRCCGRASGNDAQFEATQKGPPLISVRTGSSSILIQAYTDLRITSQLGFDLDQPVKRLIQLSSIAYNLGYFVDGMDLCREIARRGNTTREQRTLWFLNTVCYIGYRCNEDSPLYDPNPNIEFVIGEINSNGVPIVQFHGGSAGLDVCQSTALAMRSPLFEDVRSDYPIESLLLNLTHEDATDKIQSSEVDIVIERLKNNLWIVPSEHPTSALNIAKWCVDHQVYLDFARNLVNCCIGWRYPYRRIDDLLSLARLLYFFRAPQVFWTSLMALYVDFAGVDNLNEDFMLRNGVSSNLIELRRSTVNAKEGIFHRFCADQGLPGYDKLLKLVLGSLRIGVQNDGNRFFGEGGYESGAYEPWLDANAFQMRHPWYCLLQPHEQDFVRNGDTAFATCLTSDFSFGCAQWWRCVESVLRRRLITPLGDLIDANPDWVSEDITFARRRADEWDWEAIFVRSLPDPRKRQQLSLTQMLILLEKCLSDHTKKRQSSSTVRRKCVEYVGSKLSEFTWVTGELDEVADFRSVMTPRILNEETIAAFRNAASHDVPMDFANAAAGRLLAIRILDFMHYPRYCVSAKLEELKLELKQLEGRRNS